ncbi:C-C motif chemokine 27a [Pagrus major]|uniref:C-C motif chemokine 27a n=1 Tax=Pagrus major TaxID=143350 RepID=UPI003CC86E17
MDLKVAFVVICLCALAITSTEAGIPKCCITTKKSVPRHLLRKVHRYDLQENSGACDISALILYVKGMSRPICAHTHMEKIVRRLLKKTKHRTP